MNEDILKTIVELQNNLIIVGIINVSDFILHHSLLYEIGRLGRNGVLGRNFVDLIQGVIVAQFIAELPNFLRLFFVESRARVLKFLQLLYVLAHLVLDVSVL